MKRADSEGEKVSLSNDVQLIQCYGVKYCSFKLKRDGKECLVLSLVYAAKVWPRAESETAEAAALVAVVAVVAVVAKCVIHVSLSLSSAFPLPSARQRPHFQVS